MHACVLVIACGLNALLMGIATAGSEAELDIRHATGLDSDASSIVQGPRDVPVVAQVDVAVAGGGVSGVAAALKAVSEGLSVVLVEPRNYFGEEFTATRKCMTAAYEPCPACPQTDALCRELAEKKIYGGTQVNTLALKDVLRAKVMQSGRIRVYLFSMPVGVVVQQGRVCGVVMVNHSGRQAVLARAVVDATDDGRLAAAAGARFRRTLRGPKTVRRFIAAEGAAAVAAAFSGEPAPKGTVPFSLARKSGQPPSMGGREMLAVHAGHLELSFPVVIGKDVARDLSRATAVSLQKSFALREQFERSGVKLARFVVAPEILVDEMPVVGCRRQLTAAELSSRAMTDPDFYRPNGVEGLVMAGRTLSAALEVGELATLFCLGEAAGKTAVILARAAKGVAGLPSVPPGDCPDSRINESGTAPCCAKRTAGEEVRELLSGPDASEPYPLVRQSQSRLPRSASVDVIVVGGGTSGAMAAIAAARQGVKVALIEALPNLGGTGSNRVPSYYWGVTWKSRLSAELDSRIHCTRRTGPGSAEKVGFSGEEKKYVLQDLAEAAGVVTYYRSFAAGAVVEGNKVLGVVVENANGRQAVLGKVTIDATGHGDIAAAAGAGFAKGRSVDGMLHEVEHGGLLRDPTNVEDISRAYLKRPSGAINMNPRESRRIVGQYMLSFDDIIHQRRFDDVVACWRSNYDSHFPHSANEDDAAQDWIAILGLFRKPLEGQIPYRCLLPQGLENLLVAAKSYSVSHDALIAARMQRDLQHLGEAAGTAAAMACTRRVRVRDLPVDALQRELLALGVLRLEDLPAPGGARAPGPAPDLAAVVARLGTDRALDAMVELYLAGPKSLPLVRPLVADPSRAKREEAALVLGMLGDRAAAPGLLEMLRDRSPRRLVFTMANASSHPSVPLCCSAAILLGRLREKQAVPLLKESLRDPEKCTAARASFAITALERIGDRTAVEAIRPYLRMRNSSPELNENAEHDAQWGVCTTAARALARLGDLSGVPVLIELLEADQSLVRDYAQRLLEEISGQHFGKDRRRWLEWWQRRA